MISKDITAIDLADYYAQLYQVQSTAHKPEYMLVHAEIRSRLLDCISYTEFGVNQGTTLAAALLTNIPKIRAYDISLSQYNKVANHFTKYAAQHNIDFSIYETSSLNSDIDIVDCLYIDTLHTYDHLTKELIIHGNKVKKFIIFHDTYAQKGLKRAVYEYVQANTEWKIVTECDINVGFMTITRT